MPYQSVFFFEEKPSFFDKPAPNSNLLCHSFSVWVHYLKNHSDRAHRVVNSSPCCMFHTSLSTIQSKKFWNDFHLLGIGYLLCREMGMTSSCLLLLLFFLGLDTIITVIIWQIIVHRYRNKNHTFCEKISSHNYIATSSRSPNFSASYFTRCGSGVISSSLTPMVPLWAYNDTNSAQKLLHHRLDCKVE